MQPAALALIVLLVAAIGVAIYMLTRDLPSTGGSSGGSGGGSGGGGSSGGSSGGSGSGGGSGGSADGGETYSSMRRAHWAVREAWDATSSIFNDKGGLAQHSQRYPTLNDLLRSVMDNLVDADDALTAATEAGSTTPLADAKTALQSAKASVNEAVTSVAKNSTAKGMVIGDSTLPDLLEAVQGAIGRTLSYVADMTGSGDVSATKDWDALVPKMTSQQLLDSAAKALTNIASVGGKAGNLDFGTSAIGIGKAADIKEAGSKLYASARATRSLVMPADPDDAAAVKAAAEQAALTQIRVKNLVDLKKYIGDKANGQNNIEALTPAMSAVIKMLKEVRERQGKETMTVRAGRPSAGLEGLSA